MGGCFMTREEALETHITSKGDEVYRYNIYYHTFLKKKSGERIKAIRIGTTSVSLKNKLRFEIPVRVGKIMRDLVINEQNAHEWSIK